MSLDPISVAMVHALDRLEHAHDRKPDPITWQAKPDGAYHPLPRIPEGTEVTVVHTGWDGPCQRKLWATTVGPITHTKFGASYVGMLCIALDNVPVTGVERVTWRAEA